MRKASIIRGRVWIVAALAVISIAAGVGLGPVEPCGGDAGLIRFDVISELNLDWPGDTNIVVFARYWVCADYYVVSVLWTEPHGGGRNLRSQRILSDETSFDMDDEYQSFWVPANTTYPKPVGERPAFRWGGGSYGTEEMRFAEADALARRVYVGDLEAVKGRNGVVDVDVAQDLGGVRRKLAHLKVRTDDDRIESMELFDAERRLLAKMQYTYERAPGPPYLATLTAELPVRPVTVGGGTQTTVAVDGQTTTRSLPEADYIMHKGGRTCTVTYEAVALDEEVLRLPVRIRVQRSDDKQLVRSARLMNFKRVDLDKDAVWQAAKAFGGLDPMYATWDRLVDKLVRHTPDLGPLSVDPNDPAIVKRLVAKYPVWDSPSPGPRESRVQSPKRQETPPTESEAMQEFKARQRERMQEMAKEQERLKEHRRRVAQMPRPPQKDIEPNDVRLIRQLYAHYKKMSLLTKEQRAVPKPSMGRINYMYAEEGRRIMELRDKLCEILRYHRVARLPEERPPEPNDSDLELIGELKGHYEELALEPDRGLGGRLKAIHQLTWLDRAHKDFDAFESHVIRYLQMLDDAELNEMYMVGGSRYIGTFIESGRYDNARRLARLWAERSGLANSADAVYRFCGSDQGGKGYPWFSVQVLNCLLKRSDLSALERYEALALRAIALDKIDALLTDPKTQEDASRRAQAQWILKSVTRAEITKRVREAVLEAVAAWEALGPVRLTVAKPYATSNRAAEEMNMLGLPDATRLQETSARLDQIVRRRFPQSQSAPRSRPGQPSPARPQPPRRR